MEVTSGVHRIDGVNANTYLLVGDELTLIDTGMPRSAEKILGYISKELGRKPSDLTTIVLTHCHIDHAGSAYEIRRLTSAKVAVHEEDAKFVSGEKTLPSPKGILGILFKVLSPFFKLMPVQPDIRLKENDKLDRFTVIHTPGHTPGSIALYDPDSKLLFVGDLLRFNKGKVEGPPKQFTLNMDEARLSIEKISHLKFDTMLSGHGEPLKSNASDRVNEFYASWRH